MLIVGIAGGTGCGKTTVVRKVMDAFKKGEVALLPQDSYYCDNSQMPLEERQKLNFDHPDSIEWPLLMRHIRELKKGNSIRQPIYSYLTCTRSEETILIEPRKVLIVEGILILTQKEVRDLLEIKVFVDADPDDRLSRVIRRDLAERGRSADIVLDRYEKTVKPMHLEFIDPSKRYADIIIPQGGENKVGIRVLTSLIREHVNT
ncbi:MAG: uridine kinase [Bacteroidetes bacterium GWF2_49_14]|nr:MAG: uridine kinase [Bacteroidetes bacterium GWF2_49_14]HBB93352.1 uridine kinase [Bacteroidales bacterium]